MGEAAFGVPAGGLKGRLVPEKICTPEEVCLRGQAGPQGGRAWKWTVAMAVPRNQALSTG